MKQLLAWGPVCIIGAAILWALDGIVLRPLLYSLPVTTVVLLEHGLAFIIMAPFLFRKRASLQPLRAADWGAVGWVALFGGVLGTMLITKALFSVNFVNLAIILLIQKLQPVFALTLAAVILRERLPRRFFVWAVVAIIATYWVTFDRLIPQIDTQGAVALAALYSLGAAFAWGSSTVFSKRALQAVDYTVGTYLRFGITTVIMLGIALSTRTVGAIGQVTWQQWAVFAAIVFSSGGAAMLLYYFGLKRVTASLSTICELAFPVSAILFEYIIHGRALTWSQWLAAIILWFAIYRVSLVRQPALAPHAVA